MLSRTLLAAIIAASALGCVAEPLAPYEDHEEPQDFEEVPDDGAGKLDLVPATFDRNRIVDEAFFVDVEYIDAEILQRFFEATPYGRRSWLADAVIDGQPASVALVEAAKAHGLNPLVLVVRMQVEASLVGKATRPAQSRIDYAFGCGCADGDGCSAAYRGLTRQVSCAADTLRELLAASEDGSGSWRKGVTRRTLDPLRVTPANHATAALYGYTPWVLEGRGGNWLVWNVTRLYVRYIESNR